MNELDQRRGVEAGKADLVRKAKEGLYGGNAGVDGGRAGAVPSALVRMASSAICTSSTVARRRSLPTSA
jgi:hypothetical protein